MCNTFLLEEPFMERPINLGERAHIAGWKKAAGSPRGDSALPVSERNEAKNLVLLCMPCHAIVDGSGTRADYPEERLLEIKREHEERIHHLTGMSHDRETAILRVFGAVRGSVPEMAREQAMLTVVEALGRYGRFPLAPDRHSVELDLSQIPEPEEGYEDAYWAAGRKKIDVLAARVAEHVQEKHVRHVSVFALARIPLLVYLGYALDDKVPVELFQKHRGEKEGWIWPEDGPEVSFECRQIRAGQGADIALVLNLSGSIPLEDLPEAVSDLDVFEIRPAGGILPSPDLFRSRATLDAFVRSFRDFLAEAERSHRSAERIHLFLAAPITAAVACGRAVMRHVQPAIVVYDRVGNTLKPALTVNEK